MALSTTVISYIFENRMNVMLQFSAKKQVVLSSQDLLEILSRQPPIMLKFLPIMLCYAALLKLFTYYAQIILKLYASFPLLC